MFSPNHVGAPWLEMIHVDDEWRAERPIRRSRVRTGVWSLCPENAGRKNYNVHFIKLPITLAKKQGNEPPVVDPNGLDLRAARRRSRRSGRMTTSSIRWSFAANIYDCVDWTLTSEWEDDDYTNFQSSKINTHWHFLQFDNQASDGVITGFSYEQSVRPFTMLEKKTKKGLPVPHEHGLHGGGEEGLERAIPVKNAEQYHPDIEILDRCG